MQLTDLLRIPRTYKNLQRVREIVGVVVEYGWGDLLARLDLESPLALWRRRLRGRGADEAVARLTSEQRFRMALEELGPTFVKLGQILATRPDLVPLSLIRELRKLHDDVPPFSPAAARREIESALGRPVGELFARFDERPLAAASIAQVHRAALADGSEVVVKVRRPGLGDVIARDLDILRGLAALVQENAPETQAYDPPAIVEEFARAIGHEIDFAHEARNLRRFAKNFEGDPRVRVPRVHDALSGESVLTLSYVDGIKAHDLAGLEAAGVDRGELARIGLDWVLQQVFVHGFFHADPHPGNLFVLAEPDGPVIVPVDMGQMGVVDPPRIDLLLELLVGVLLGDAERIAKLFRKEGLVDEDADLRALRRDVGDFVEEYRALAIGEVDVAQMFQGLFELLARHRVRVPPELFLMAKALATVEGMARELDPSLDPLEAMRPFVLKLYLERLSDPRFLARDVIAAGESAVELALAAPRDLRRILADLRRGALRLGVRVEELDRVLREQARSANRTALALVVAASLVASALLLGQQAGPQVLGLPLSSWLALAGFAGSGFGLSILGFGFLRSGRF